MLVLSLTGVDPGCVKTQYARQRVECFFSGRSKTLRKRSSISINAMREKTHSMGFVCQHVFTQPRTHSRHSLGATKLKAPSLGLLLRVRVSRSCDLDPTHAGALDRSLHQPRGLGFFDKL